MQVSGIVDYGDHFVELAAGLAAGEKHVAEGDRDDTCLRARAGIRPTDFVAARVPTAVALSADIGSTSWLVRSLSASAIDDLPAERDRNLDPEVGSYSAGSKLLLVDEGRGRCPGCRGP